VEKSTNVRPQQLGAKEMRDRIAALADAGVQHFILSLEPPFDRDVVRRFALEVAAPLREKRTVTPQPQSSSAPQAYQRPAIEAASGCPLFLDGGLRVG
jgi:hypothetical protein